MKFETSNPRTSLLVNPYAIGGSEYPQYSQAFKKMVLECAFPEGFGNGLYHMVIGVWVCIAGFFCITFGPTGAEDTIAGTNLLLPIAGAVAASFIAYIYCKNLQLKALFPRGASMRGSRGNAPVVAWLLPAVAFVACPVYFATIDASAATALSVGAVFALVALLAYVKTNRVGLLGVSLVCMLLPLMLYRLNICITTSTLGIVLGSAPYEGIVFVACGIFLMNSSMSTRPEAHDRNKIASYLQSGNRLKEFAALAYLCGKLDPFLLPDLLRLTQNSDSMVAFTAQVAVGNMWGPRPSGIDTLEVSIAPGLPPEYRQAIEARIEAQQQMVHDKWLAHHAFMEKSLREIAEEEGETAESLFALASGCNVQYMPARVVAVEMLGSMRTPRAYSMLMTLLQHRNKRVANAAVVGFYGADSKAVLYLEKFFAASKPWLCRRAIAATRNMLYYLLTFEKQDANVAYALLEHDVDALFDTNDTGVFAATIGLLPARDEGEVQVLEAYFANPRPAIKIEAMCALAHLAPEQAEAHVEEALESPYAAVRYAAIKCVDVMGMPQRARTFQNMANDSSERVANLARQNLYKLESAARQTRMFM